MTYFKKMKAKKHLGQNFLKSKKIVERMVRDSLVEENDTVIEIGPGKGILTEELLKRAKEVIAIEKDTALLDHLKEKFADEIKEKKLSIINEDFLKFNLNKKNLKGGYKVVANIPYYITGEIIRKLLESKNQPKSLTLLVQKEVAKRIVAHEKKESILSLSIKSYGAPKITEVVKKNMFNPAPKVDSAVITISSISKIFFTTNNIKEEKFFEIIKQGFSQKRKRLKNNLSKFGKEKIDSIFNSNNIDDNVRAEDLSLDTWAKIVSNL